MASTVCQYAERCPLYSGDSDISPTLERVLRERYCYAGNVACARYQVREALGQRHVPRDLLPTDHARAEEILRRG